MLSGDEINVIVQSVMLSSEKLTMMCQFSEKATALYEAGQITIGVDAAGRPLPYMYDKTGKVFEMARGGGELSVRVSQACGLLVSVAHIISAADIARTLTEVDRKLTLLITGRHIDHDAKLCTHYTKARALLLGGLDAAVVRELFECRYDLFELRQVWCRELLNQLRITTIPNHPGSHPSSWWRRKSREQKAVDNLVPFVQNLQRLRIALFTDACVAVASGTTVDLVNNVVPTERDLWEPVKKKAAELRLRFRKKGDEMERVCDAIGAYIDILDRLAGRHGVGELPAHDSVPAMRH